MATPFAQVTWYRGCRKV